MDKGFPVDYSDDYKDRTWKWYEPYFLRFSNKPQKVLDIGCGVGMFMECCVHYGVECVGMELSKSAMKYLKGKGYEVIRQDLGKPYATLADESFDAVFSCQVIEHLSPASQMNMMRESYRVLKKGGQLQVDSPCRYFREAQECDTHIGLLAPKELRAMALEVGFKEIRMDYNYRQSFDDLPDEIVEELWQKYQPDIFAQTATILALKS